MADQYNIYLGVNTGLTGILIKPLFILWIILLCMGRRRSDPARVGVGYLKAAMPFEVLAMLFYTISNILYLIYYNTDYDYDDSYFYNTSDLLALEQASTRTSIIGGLFENIADILVILTFVELSNGFFYIADQRRTTLQRVLRYVALAVGLVILAVSLARFGKINDVYTKYYDAIDPDEDYLSSDSYDYIAFENGLKVVRKLSSAIAVLLFVTSVPIFALAVMVLVKSHRNTVIKNSAVILLVASILHLIRRIWGLIYVAAWLIPGKYPPFKAVQIVDPIFNIWIFFVVLVLLYTISVRKQQGLWSTPQAWMRGAPPPAMTGQPLPPMNQAWGQYPPQQVVYVQPAPGYGLQGGGQPVAQGWQGQQQPGYYYNQGQPIQQQPTGITEMPQSHVSNGFHQPHELKT